MRLLVDPLFGKMRRTFLLVLMLIACVNRAPNTFVTPSGLALSTDAGVVQFFHAESGRVKDCPDCILLETEYDGERISHFVEPESSCHLVRGDVKKLDARQGDEYYGVTVELKPSGVRQLNRCARRESEDEYTLSFLLTVDGVVVGVDFFSGFTLKRSYYSWTGDERLRAIADALRPPIIPTVEL